jgi:hypothetical protein
MTGEVSVTSNNGAVVGADVTLRVRGGSFLAGFTSEDIDVTTGADGTGAIDVTLPSTGLYTVRVLTIAHGTDVYSASRNTVNMRSVYIV